MNDDDGGVRVVPLDIAEAPSQHDAAHRPWRRLGPVIGILAGVTLIWAAPWGPVATDTTDSIPALVDRGTAAETVRTLAPVELTAAGTFRAFVAAVDRADIDVVLDLMSPEIPDVAGLGTLDYPQLAADPDLWADGTLDGGGVADFLHNASGQAGWLVVSGCESFADGPEVTVAACTYTVRGPWVPGGFIQESGQVFGFVVDDKLAGVAHRSEEVITARPLD